MLKGKKIFLEAIEKVDLEQLRVWRNNREFRKYFREYKEINITTQEKWYENKVLNDPQTIMFSIKKIVDNELIGCCGLCYINWIHRTADLSLYIGWNNAYIDEEGYAKESCQLLFDYAFNEIGIHKIWTEIYVFDNKKIKLYEKLGFHLDGTLRDNYFYEGKWWDSLVYSLLDDEWRKLI